MCFSFYNVASHRSNYVSKANFSITKSSSPSNRRYGKAMITRIWFKLAQNWFNIASTLAQHWFNIGSTFRYPVFWREKYHYIQHATEVLHLTSKMENSLEIQMKNFGCMLNIKLQMKNFGCMLNIKIQMKNFGCMLNIKL